MYVARGCGGYGLREGNGEKYNVISGKIGVIIVATFG
jgi:hypothetical protein